MILKSGLLFNHTRIKKLLSREAEFFLSDGEVDGGALVLAVLGDGCDKVSDDVVVDSPRVALELFASRRSHRSDGRVVTGIVPLPRNNTIESIKMSIWVRLERLFF